MHRLRVLLMSAGVGLALAAGPARAVQTIGFQTIVDFEELATGDTTIHYGPIDTYISGGVVTDAASAGLTAHSGQNVYVGTSILSQQTDGDLNFQGVDLWPRIAAYVSPGGADVTATFLGFDPDANAVVTLGQATTSGNAANQLLSFDYAGGPDLINVRFTSDLPFAIDDLTLGLPDAPFGIPEPTTWALSILGFLAAGGALRTRRSLA